MLCNSLCFIAMGCFVTIPPSCYAIHLPLHKGGIGRLPPLLLGKIGTPNGQSRTPVPTIRGTSFRSANIHLPLWGRGTAAFATVDEVFLFPFLLGTPEAPVGRWLAAAERKYYSQRKRREINPRPTGASGLPSKNENRKTSSTTAYGVGPPSPRGKVNICRAERCAANCRDRRPL